MCVCVCVHTHHWQRTWLNLGDYSQYISKRDLLRIKRDLVEPRRLFTLDSTRVLSSRSCTSSTARPLSRCGVSSSRKTRELQPTCELPTRIYTYNTYNVRIPYVCMNSHICMHEFSHMYALHMYIYIHTYNTYICMNYICMNSIYIYVLYVCIICLHAHICMYTYMYEFHIHIYLYEHVNI